MLSLENLLLFVPTMTLMVILPGPDFAIVSRITLLEGRSMGQAAAIGVALGICLHTLLAILGISALIAGSPFLFGLLRYAGSIYLVWLGIHALCHDYGSDGGETCAADAPGRGPLKAFRAGFLTNALNPKAVLFFIVLLPQFVDPSASLAGQFLEMGLLGALIGLAWFLALASILERARAFFASEVWRARLGRLTGAVFMAFGLRLALQDMG